MHKANVLLQTLNPCAFAATLKVVAIPHAITRQTAMFVFITSARFLVDAGVPKPVARRRLL
jgi:hypothetical protein